MAEAEVLVEKKRRHPNLGVASEVEAQEAQVHQSRAVLAHLAVAQAPQNYL